MYAKCTLYSLGKNVIKLPSRVFAKMNFAKGSKNNAEFVKNKTMYATISRKIEKFSRNDFLSSLETSHNLCKGTRTITDLDYTLFFKLLCL